MHRTLMAFVLQCSQKKWRIEKLTNLSKKNVARLLVSMSVGVQNVAMAAIGIAWGKER